MSAKPTKVAAVLWNGGMGQDGVAPGRDSYEWYGLGLWRADHWMVTDEFGARKVMTTQELHQYYE